MAPEEDKSKILRDYCETAKNSNHYLTVKEYFKNLKDNYGFDYPDHGSRLQKHYSIVGLTASAICEARNIPVGTEDHPKYYRINTYPEKILVEVDCGHLFPDLFPDYTVEILNSYPVPRRKNWRDF